MTDDKLKPKWRIVIPARTHDKDLPGHVIEPANADFPPLALPPEFAAGPSTAPPWWANPAITPDDGIDRAAKDVLHAEARQGDASLFAGTPEPPDFHQAKIEGDGSFAKIFGTGKDQILVLFQQSEEGSMELRLVMRAGFGPFELISKALVLHDTPEANAKGREAFDRMTEAEARTSANSFAVAVGAGTSGSRGRWTARACARSAKARTGTSRRNGSGRRNEPDSQPISVV